MTGTRSTSKASSIIRSQQTKESYPDLNNLKRELERAQRERYKTNLARDQAKLERDQANLERDQAIPDRDLLRAEREQAESVANCDQIESEIERLQRRQHEVASGKERKMKTTNEPLTTRSRQESRMEVDDAPKSSGCFNLDRVTQEHMNERLDTWMPSEPVPSLRNQESGRIRPQMDIVLPGLTPSSTSGSQAGAETSRLKQ